MNLTYFFFVLLLCLHYQFNQCNSEHITFLSAERPVVNWFDKRYIKNFTLISRRLRRQDPRYYVDLILYSLIPMDNNVKVSYYFYQFVTNIYKPSFIELHFRFCDLINTDTIFGQPLRNAIANAIGDAHCPLPPAEYHLQNMTVPYVPKGFPFTKGRIYCNVSLSVNGVNELIGGGHIDMEVKSVRIRNY